MAKEFRYDVFLSHSSKDKPVVRAIAERLRADGLRVWFDSWVLTPGDNISAKIEEGLEYSRVLVLCISAHAFGSDWAGLESGTFRFRDPLNKERRFIPLRLDEAPIKGSLAQFLYINWLAEEREQEYAKLLDACLPPRAENKAASELRAKMAIRLEIEREVYAYGFDSSAKRFITGTDDGRIEVWDLNTGECLSVFEGHTNQVWAVALSPDGRRALSSSDINPIHLWDVETGKSLYVLEGHTGSVSTVAWSADGRRALSGALDQTMRLWNVETGKCLHVLEGHTDDIWTVAWSPDGRRALSGGRDNSVRLWDVETGMCLSVLEGHSDSVWSVAWSPDGRFALSSASDHTLRLWDVDAARCLRVLEGHTNGVVSVAWSPDGRHALSGARDGAVLLWDVKAGQCLQEIEGPTSDVWSVAWSVDPPRGLCGEQDGVIWAWALPGVAANIGTPASATLPLPPEQDQIHYTNAKVLLVGESSAGKTGLSRRLASNDWQPSDSTVGAWATQWKLPVASRDGAEREIWLWDFGGQADQRLIHQLYMDEAAVAVLVFDGQKDDLFETLGQWDRDLTRASSKAFSKLLTAGRVDAGGLRVSRNQLEAFKKERGYLHLLETSAKTGQGCEELKQAIIGSIRWEDIPWRSSPLLFKRLKDEIVRLKDEGRVLMRFNELQEALTLRLSSEGARFTHDELRTVVKLLEGPGVVWGLKFGSWVLLQPERINAYAQAVIQTMRADEHERGCLTEERVLNGDLTYHSSMARLEADEERFILLAMHQMLVEHGLCLREHTDRGVVLVFPSYYRRERPELVGHPAILVSYRFNGFLDDIYSTLVVRMHHTQSFEGEELWRYAADFRTLTGKQLGVKLSRLSEGAGELQVYFDPTISMEEKIIFSKYVHEHLQQNAKGVVRLRHYVCPHCGTPAGNPDVAMRKLKEGKDDIPCVNCDDPAKRIPLWDQLEELFASPEMKDRVRELQRQSDIVLDNESKDRALVGEVISTVALAGQLSRELAVSDHGIDMEIEFKSDAGEATGRKVYLQLKSGDSYLSSRKSDDVEIFKIKDERHARYWMDQAFPVMLVIRNSKGEIRWMEVRDWLRHASASGQKAVRQIVFKGERFDVMSVRRWRERALH